MPNTDGAHLHGHYDRREHDTMVVPTRKHRVLSMGCLRRQAWEYTPYEYALVHDEGVADHGIDVP